MALRSVDVLLLGGGVAAARCARTLRRHGFSGSILLVSDEELPPYNRPPLSKELLRDDLPSELVLAEPMAWYERRGVELALATSVVGLDVEERTVTLADGARLRFAQLLLATGAEPRRPILPGAEHAVLLRTLSDAEGLRSRAVAGQRAVVIGGGFIGVEVASSLAARGMAVTIVEVAPALWAGTLGTALSDWARQRLASVSVEVRLRATCESVAPGGVRLASERLAADLIVAGVGVLPRVHLAEAAGLEVDNGVLVDEAQRTSAAGVFAAGDMARPRDGMRVEHWHAAREGGERAALAMLDQPVPPRRAPWVFSEFAGRTLDVFGLAAGLTNQRTFEKAGALAAVAFGDRGGPVQQLAVVDAAISPEVARALVERRATVDEIGPLIDG